MVAVDGSYIRNERRKQCPYCPKKTAASKLQGHIETAHLNNPEWIGEAMTMKHEPTGKATVVVYPKPIVVIIECSCGDPSCYWSVTDEKPIHNIPK